MFWFSVCVTALNIFMFIQTLNWTSALGIMFGAIGTFLFWSLIQTAKTE
jgi:hypothetical protein